MKCLLLFVFPLCLCSLSRAQFRERPSTAAIRAGRLETHVEGDVAKVLDLAVDGRVIALGFSPKSDFLAVATPTPLTLLDQSCTHKLLIWDALKEPDTNFGGRPSLRATLAFSPDSKQLFFCGVQGLSAWSWPNGLSTEQSPLKTWSAPEVYNVALVDADHIVCAAKKGSTQVVQLRKVSDGSLVWERESGLDPITALWSQGTTLRFITGSPTGSQAYWNEWQVRDGHSSLPTDLGAQNAFSASFSPDGQTAAMVSRSQITLHSDSLALQLITLATGEAKVATAPFHFVPGRYRERYYWRDYPYWWSDYFDWWPDYRSVDSGWTTLFSPDGKSVASIGKEVVFYDKSTGSITARIYFSLDPFPSVGITQAESDGVGAFTPDGKNFALVRQGHVTYSAMYNRGAHRSEMQRLVPGDSAVEIYALGT